MLRERCKRTKLENCEPHIQSRFRLNAAEPTDADLAGQRAEIVYRLRTVARLTQSELARRIGTTQSAIARVANGGSAPSLSNWNECDVLLVPRSPFLSVTKLYILVELSSLVKADVVADKGYCTSSRETAWQTCNLLVIVTSGPRLSCSPLIQTLGNCPMPAKPGRQFRLQDCWGREYSKPRVDGL